MVIVVFAGFFIVFYDSTTSIFPKGVSQLHRHSCLGKRPFGPSGRCYLQQIALPLTRAFLKPVGQYEVRKCTQSYSITSLCL